MKQNMQTSNTEEVGDEKDRQGDANIGFTSRQASLETVESTRRRNGTFLLYSLESNLEWTGLEFAKFQRAVEYRVDKEETGCEVICGAPTTPRLRELRTPNFITEG